MRRSTRPPAVFGEVGHTIFQFGVRPCRWRARHTGRWHPSQWLARISGARTAIIINNNAAAVYLVLAALANKMVIMSRQAYQNWRWLRIPDTMAESGAALREVRHHEPDKIGGLRARHLRSRPRHIHVPIFAFVFYRAAADHWSPLGKAAVPPVYEDLGSGACDKLHRTVSER